MSTTEILFNSPALHSLKRNQLVQLCKKHDIKANGKNIEIIARLKQYALTLPADSPLNVAVRSEEQLHYGGMEVDDDDNDSADDDSGLESRHKAQRPSEMWEVVMEDIPEEVGESQGSLSSSKTVQSGQASGEFGSVKGEIVYDLISMPLICGNVQRQV